jgi:hypothetical protein
VTVQVTPQASGSGTGSGTAPGAPTGLKTSYGDGFIALSWSPPGSAGSSPVTGYHVYMGFSPSFTAAREFTTGTSFRLTDAENGSTYFIKVTAVSAAGEGPATPVTSVIPDPHVTPAPPPAAGGGSGSVTAQPSPSPLPSKDVSQHGASSSPPAGLIIGLAALALAAAGGATAIVVIQRRRNGRGYAPVPAPRRPYDDEPARPSGRTEEKSGPRYR